MHDLLRMLDIFRKLINCSSMNSISKAQLLFISSLHHHINLILFKKRISIGILMLLGFNVVFMNFIGQILVSLYDRTCIVAVIADPLGPVLWNDPFDIVGPASRTNLSHHDNYFQLTHYYNCCNMLVTLSCRSSKSGQGPRQAQVHLNVSP